MLLANIKKEIRTGLLLLYFIGSLVMCQHYETFFNKKDNEAFKEFLGNNTERIYTDHFTKYSIDLIDGYAQPVRTQRILGKDFNLKRIKSGDLVVYHKKHIKELEGQSYVFPDWTVLESPLFIKSAGFGEFIIYEKSVSDTSAVF